MKSRNIVSVFFFVHFFGNAWGNTLFDKVERRQNPNSGAINYNPNGTEFIWLLEDTYQGKTFFDSFSFYTGEDPTHGQVTFLNASEAFSQGLAFVDDNGTVFMKADDFTTLPLGTYRDSVRIASNKLYTTGLFILDLNRAPYGCAIWPAFWTVGPDWPAAGEIDVLEGVHDNQYNQVTWHTLDGCILDPNTNFTGTIVQQNGTPDTNCVSSNNGCGITEFSRSSYGEYFDSLGGGVLAMKWDENSISVWSFYRAAIPTDIISGEPNPSHWGPPSATLLNSTCNIEKYFYNHQIIFDITLCGDWAGNSYATSGCPGTCEQRLTDPTNFVNATFSINWLKVYRKQPINTLTPTSFAQKPSFVICWWTVLIFWLAILQN